MADNYKYVQAQKFRLAGSGITSSATSLILQTFKTPNGTNLAMTDFGTLGHLVLEPGTSREETVSFTGVTQNADGTATLSGLTRGLGFVSPYTNVLANQLSHGGGTIAVVSNPPAFYDKFTNKENDESIAGTWDFAAVPSSQSDPVGDNDLARKSWVLANLPGGTVSVDRVVVAGQAGETVTSGQLVYFDLTDNEWKLCDADTAALVNNVLIGIAQGAGTNGNAIANGVLLNGLDSNQSGLNQGDLVYASNTAGGISASAGTTERVIGIARTSTSFYFDSNFYYTVTANQKAALAGGSGTPSATNRFLTEAQLKFGGTGADGALTITSGTTTIDLAGAVSVIKNYTSISITGTGALAFSNPHANGTLVILKSQGAVTITSSANPAIDGRNIGGAGGAGSGSTTGATGTTGSAVIGTAPTGGAGGVASASGGAGGAAGGVVSPVFNANFGMLAQVIPVVIGAGGGGGGYGSNSSVGGTGGRGGGAIIINCGGALNFTSTISCAGTAGSAATEGVTPNQSAGGGGGGGGGTFHIFYNSLTSAAGSVVVTGGTGGAGGTLGSSGTGGGGGGGGGTNTAGVIGTAGDGSGNGGAGGAGGDGLSIVALNTEFL